MSETLERVYRLTKNHENSVGLYLWLAESRYNILSHAEKSCYKLAPKKYWIPQNNFLNKLQ